MRNTMSALNGICFSVYVALFLFIIAVIPLGQSLKHKDGLCFKDGCQCHFPNGKFIDLSHHNLLLTSISGQTNWTIIFHPCEDFKFGNNTKDNECFNGASICLQNTANNNTIRLGRAKMGEFHSIDSTQNVSVTFTEGSRTTTLYLKCLPGAQDNFTAVQSGDNYELTWTSSSNATCPSLGIGTLTGMSTGSMLIIIFMVFTMVYFGGGMLALKYLRGAEGKEMIPNYDFWVDLPYLVRDGILFVLGGFNTPTSYDRI